MLPNGPESRTDATLDRLTGDCDWPLNVLSDQSLFIRHIRAKRRPRWRGLKLKAAGEEDETDEEDGDSTDTDEALDVSDHGKQGISIEIYPQRERVSPNTSSISASSYRCSVP